jgi:hypothetical protein
LRSLSTLSVLLVLSLQGRGAGAVCLDPATLVSGHVIPLDEEVRRTEAIVVGRVLSARALREDPADPDGVTADDLTLEVVASLKGQLPGQIVIRNENTSARYPMAVGEEHLLFIARSGGSLSVDSCGNLARMPAGRKLVPEIQLKLKTLE